MRVTGRNPELRVVVAVQLQADPAAEGSAAAAHVGGDVEDAAARHPHQLALRMRRGLQMEAAQHAARRARVVVLDEGNRRADGVVERLLVEALEEEATRVAEHLRFEDEHAGQRGRGRLHQNTWLSAICSRYWP